MKFIRVCFSLSIFALCLTTATRFLAAVPLPGSSDWDSGFDGQRAWRHVAVLASDSLRGRYSGFDGADKADRFLCGYYRSLDLTAPFGEDGFQQRFTYGAGEYSKPTKLVFRFEDGRIDTAFMWKEYNIFKYSGFGEVHGPLVFVGFGVSAPEKGWDDYAGIDVTGTVVLALRGGPELPNVEWDRELLNGFKSSTALAKGAVGYLVTDEVVPKYATLGEGFYRAELPAAWISSDVADSLLKETGLTRQEWKKRLDETRQPDSRRLSLTAELQVSGQYYPERPTCNIVAVLPGTDDKLQQEAVLIGAHMDHHGVDAMGNIYRGADDNASGTAAVMELARVFAESPIRHRRTLLFAGFAGEEEGLVGSKKMVERLPVGGCTIVSMINMDMVGQGDGSVGIGGLDEFPRLGDMMFADYPDTILSALEFWGLYQGSDHASFEEAGIPSYVIGARGPHPNYHTPCDTAGAIKPEILKAVGDMVYHCAAALADYPKPLASDLDQANWITRRDGGTEFIGLEPPGQPEFKTVKGVEYPADIIIMNLKEERKHLSLEDLIAGLETARGLAERRGLPLAVDSTHKRVEPPSFRGLMTVIPYKSAPKSLEALRSLARLGLSFVDCSELMEGILKRQSAAQFETLAENCRQAGVGLLCRVDRTETAVKAARISRGWMLFQVPVSRLKANDLSILSQSGGFVLMEDDGKPSLPSGEALSSQAREILASDNRARIGLTASPRLFRLLLNAGISVEDLTDMSQQNLRVYLRDWWADNQSE